MSNTPADNSNSKPVALVVDDSLECMQMLNDALEEAGFTVLVALEGSQALTITHNIRPDIILLDAIMPHMDGFETCRQLKRRAQLADVPILFMTGLTDTDHVVMGFEAGGVDYVTKPINMHELLARMRAHLNNARITRQARRALDGAGQFLLTVDGDGRLRWATPQVCQLLEQAEASIDATSLQPALSQRLADWLRQRPESGQQLRVTVAGGVLQLELLTVMDGKEYLLRLGHSHNDDDDSALLRQKLGLTLREGDVLLWIARGKTNREIGQILEMSPRTVNKHLEQIFRKLGVENRTSAAAVALKWLSKS
ncbi:MAG: response regulator [Gammaproteobacteria bacterium]|nr:response regulator [Gammaproteobacteria bacterium]